MGWVRLWEDSEAWTADRKSFPLLLLLLLGTVWPLADSPVALSISFGPWKEQL